MSSPVSCLEWDAGSHLLWGMTCLSVYRQCLEREFSGLLPGVGRRQSSAVGYDLSVCVPSVFGAGVLRSPAWSGTLAVICCGV